MPELTTFHCMNCRKEKAGSEAVPAPWVAHIGLFFFKGGLAGKVCNECIGSVTLLGWVLTGFIVFITIGALVSAL
jgi:hypothetical protein